MSVGVSLDIASVLEQRRLTLNDKNKNQKIDGKQRYISAWRSPKEITGQKPHRDFSQTKIVVFHRRKSTVSFDNLLQKAFSHCFAFIVYDLTLSASRLIASLDPQQHTMIRRFNQLKLFCANWGKRSNNRSHNFKTIGESFFLFLSSVFVQFSSWFLSCWSNRTWQVAFGCPQWNILWDVASRLKNIFRQRYLCPSDSNLNASRHLKCPRKNEILNIANRQIVLLKLRDSFKKYWK